MGGRNEPPERNGAPEPPERWKPGDRHSASSEPPPEENGLPETKSGALGATSVELTGGDIAEFESARRLVTVSQVSAVVSLLVGGVLLSTVALVCAIVAYRKFDGIASRKEAHPDMQRALRRVGAVAIVFSAVILVINAVALCLLYPVFMERLQAGGFGSLLGGFGSSGGGAGNSTWG